MNGQTYNVLAVGKKKTTKKVNECCWQLGKLNPLCRGWLSHQQTPEREKYVSVL